VLYPEGTFGLNYIRGLGIVLCWLALLASIGLAAASWLSFPVAAFFSLAVLMIGTNNTGGTDNAGTATAAEIAEGIGAIVLEMRNDFPQAKILLLAIFPRGVPGDSVRDKIAEINRLIAKLDDQRHVFYMDIGPKFLDEKGSFLAGAFRPDNLHPTAKGYEIWGAAVKDKLAELTK